MRTIACLLVAATLAAGQGHDKPDRLAELLKARAASVVGVRAVLRLEFGGMTRETTNELPGVIVDAKGLVLTQNTALDPNAGRGGDPHGTLAVTPANLKVILPDGTELGARIVHQDVATDLAFLAFDPGRRRLTPVSFDEAATVSVGQEVVTVSRLAEGYGRAPVFRVSRVNGVIQRPRHAFCVDAPGDQGLAVYSLDGAVLGINTRLAPEGESGAARNPLSAVFGGIGATARIFLVTADQVAPLIVAARKARAEGERKAAPESRKTEGK